MKNEMRSPGIEPAERVGDERTRDRVARVLLEGGPATAVELGEQLNVSPTAIRRHLDALVSQGRVEAHEQPARGPRGRGRPARFYALTDEGRASFPHTYDDLAASALRYLSRVGGPGAVSAFAADRVALLEERCRTVMDGAGGDPVARAEALASALSDEGYAASASTIAGGGQLCQHHCPVAQVAAEFPQLCEEETKVISRLVGSHVQRLATIAHGDGVCTTHIPGPALATSARLDTGRPTRPDKARPATPAHATSVSTTTRPRRTSL